MRFVCGAVLGTAAGFFISWQWARFGETMLTFSLVSGASVGLLSALFGDRFWERSLDMIRWL